MARSFWILSSANHGNIEIVFFLIVQARKPRTDKLTSSLLKSERRNDPEHSQEEFRVSPQHPGSHTKSSPACLLFWSTWGWLSLAYNRPTWVTCRFHLAEWPSCHIPKDIGAGLAKWYGWVMGCRPHPDTLWRWGAAAKPWSLLTSPCGRSIFANMSPHELLSPSLTCQTILFAYVWVTHLTKKGRNMYAGVHKAKRSFISSLRKRFRLTGEVWRGEGGGALTKLLRFVFYLSFLISKNLNLTLGQTDTKAPL